MCRFDGPVLNVSLILLVPPPHKESFDSTARGKIVTRCPSSIRVLRSRHHRAEIIVDHVLLPFHCRQSVR